MSRKLWLVAGACLPMRIESRFSVKFTSSAVCKIYIDRVKIQLLTQMAVFGILLLQVGR